MARILLIIALAFTSFPAGAQSASEPLAMRRSDVGKLVTEAPPAYIREVSPGSGYVGLFDKAGKQLLGAHYFNTGLYDTSVAMHDNILFLSDTVRYATIRNKKLIGLYTIGAFSRGGLLLYEAFIYDNGPDFFSEGRQRFVYNGKMGFVNRLGEVTIPARYSFVYPYEHGVAYACLDCVYKKLDSNDEEHCCGFVGRNYVLIDKAGNELARKKIAPDQQIQFETPAARISAREAALGRIILNNRTIQDLLKKSDATPIKRSPVCYDTPSIYSPYYHIALVDTTGWSSTDFQFLISPDGRHILHLSSYTLTPETLAAWKRDMYASYRQ